jgi:3-hydroxypropanoate dehydrogenase
MHVSTEQLFTAARSHNRFLDEPVADDTLHALYALLKWGPTTANSCPARFVFVRSAAAKEALVACMTPGNVEKTRSAPVIAIVGMDLAFYEELPRLYPATDARSWFAGKPQDHIRTTALRNSSLQGAYLMLAARSLGLDCGPMGGFDAAQVDAAFFAGTTVTVNFVVALGRGRPEALYPRGPRLAFDEACRIA